MSGCPRNINNRRKPFSRQIHTVSLLENALRICLLIAFLCIMAGCQTVKITKPFSADDVLPDTDSMYVKIPVKNNKSICQSIISSYIVGLTEKDCSDLMERSETIYASVDFTNNSINAAIVGNFPFFIDMVFTSKNGWKSHNYSDGRHSVKYYVSSGSGFQVAVLQRAVMLVSSADIQILLKRLFAYEDATVEDLTENTLETDIPSGSSIIGKKDVLKSTKTDISFYTSKAGSFIESIIGNGITLAANEAAGFFEKETESEYVLDMEMTFTNKHALKPALFLFKKAGTSGQVETEALSELSMKCTGMTMDIKTIVSLLIGG